MQHIQQLSPRLANQIAAGEVVERPAAVIKELLENSLDAKADTIDIDVEQGGIKRLCVRDNGKGILQDDLPLALSRHATSKIQALHDLESVTTLGFRGEALASISSVSRLTLTSRTEKESPGWRVYCEGTDMEPVVAPAPHPVGTTVDVRELFFNTPARRKFLRTEKTEFSRIDEVVRKLALSRYDVALTLKHNQRVQYQLRPAKTQTEKERRVSHFFGQEFIDHAVSVDVEVDGLRLWGWVGLPTFSRSQSDQQFFYINGRMIRDKIVSHAVRQAYQDVLYGGRHPVFILYLELDPVEVDVNVHPTKHEVRFRDNRRVHGFIYSMLNRALADVRPEDKLDKISQAESAHSEGGLVDKAGFDQGGVDKTNGGKTSADNIFDSNSNSNANKDTPVSLEASPVIQRSIPLQASESRPLSRTHVGAGAGSSSFLQVARRAASQTSSVELPSMQTYHALYGKSKDDLSKKDNQSFESESIANQSNDVPPLGFAVGQVKGVYILAENAHGMIMVDMHAAHERITYERMKRSWSSDKIRVQPLLIPESIAVSVEESECAEENQGVLSALGLKLEVAGQESVIVRHIPALLQGADIAALVHEVLQGLFASRKQSENRG